MALTSLTAGGWKRTFQNFGRLAMVRDQVGTSSPTFHSGVVMSVKTLAEEDFSLVSNMVGTFVSNMNTLSSNLASGKTNVESSITSLVTSTVKGDINSSATTASGILMDMFTVMRTDSVAISGTTAGKLLKMFREVYGFHEHFIPRYDGATHVSPDAGAVTTAIWDGYADLYGWEIWGAH